MPNDPGIVVKIGQRLYEHCTIPSLSLTLDRIFEIEDNPEKFSNMYVGGLRFVELHLTKGLEGVANQNEIARFFNVH